MGNPIRVEKQRQTFDNPSQAFMQHLHEVAAVHWPRKDIAKGKAAKPAGNKIQFNRQTASHPTKTHRVARLKKYTK